MLLNTCVRMCVLLGVSLFSHDFLKIINCIEAFTVFMHAHNTNTAPT